MGVASYETSGILRNESAVRLGIIDARGNLIFIVWNSTLSRTLIDCLT